MKSQEEIEQLAKQLCNIPIDLVIDEEERYYKNFQKYDGIIQGYTQCQEDNEVEMDRLKKIMIESSNQAMTWEEKYWQLKNSLNKQG